MAAIDPHRSDDATSAILGAALFEELASDGLIPAATRGS